MLQDDEEVSCVLQSTEGFSCPMFCLRRNTTAVLRLLGAVQPQNAVNNPGAA
jgi:hypothetical protein